MTATTLISCLLEEEDADEAIINVKSMAKDPYIGHWFKVNRLHSTLFCQPICYHSPSVFMTTVVKTETATGKIEYIFNPQIKMSEIENLYEPTSLPDFDSQSMARVQHQIERVKCCCLGHLPKL